MQSRTRTACIVAIDLILAGTSYVFALWITEGYLAGPGKTGTIFAAGWAMASYLVGRYEENWNRVGSARAAFVCAVVAGMSIWALDINDERASGLFTVAAITLCAALSQMARSVFDFAWPLENSLTYVYCTKDEAGIIESLKTRRKFKNQDCRVFIDENIFRRECKHSGSSVNVIISKNVAINKETFDTLTGIDSCGRAIRSLESWYSALTHRVLPEAIESRSMAVQLNQICNSSYRVAYLRAKRILEPTAAIALLVLLSPLMLILAIAIKLDDGGSIFFTQKRTGEGCKEFRIYKFRSMSPHNKDRIARTVWSYRDDERVTRVGTFMRNHRLDEIPQLINVAFGDMSFVGPRPEQVSIDEILKKEIPYYLIRYFAKPGITGWAQVMFRYGNSISDSRTKLTYDLFYIKNMTLFLDIEILARTVITVLSGNNHNDEAAQNIVGQVK